MNDVQLSFARPQRSLAASWDAEMDVSSFLIGHDDVVLEADEGWSLFAKGNAGDDVLAEPVGRSLWELIKDPAAQGLYRLLLTALRDRGVSRISYPFRCDSPHERRYLRMIIEVSPDKRVRFTSYAHATERNTIVRFKAELARPQTLKISEKRKAVHIDGGWTDIVHALCGAEIFNEHSSFRLVLAD